LLADHVTCQPAPALLVFTVLIAKVHNIHSAVLAGEAKGLRLRGQLIWSTSWLLLLLLLQVIRLKAALNEKDMELIELREQHMQLVVSSKTCSAVTQYSNQQW
jgi:hypothetical protein